QRTRPGSPVERALAELEPVQLVLATDLEDQALWNEYVERYHYLGYKKPFGYVQRYFIEAGPHRLGCLLLSGPAKALTARERWIGELSRFAAEAGSAPSVAERLRASDDPRAWQMAPRFEPAPLDGR
ncbi:MAG: Druantia anti-phage system protein DruA, partial [Myxococcota bacterium]